jgi:PTH1 family peptidyl-tRNA hydrolase
VDELAGRMGGALRPHKSRRADVLEGRLELGGPRVVLGRARTYMNVSGGPVKELVSFYKVPFERLVVVHDEIDLPFGSLRVKLGGGDNGHNGLRSLRSALGTGEFHRVRIGVGRPPAGQSAADYVLSMFTLQQKSEIPLVGVRSADAVVSLMHQGLEKTQADFNA